MRKLLLLALILTSVLQWPSSSQAKGVSDRIVISSVALAEDIIVEDDGMVHLLSYYMVDYEAELLVPPPDLDLSTAYRLQRQFYHGGDFQTFDHVAYYQGKDGGYVHYMGLENGSSEYDGKWYRVQPESDMAMQYLLTSQHLAEYIIAYQTNGQFQLLDPETLETAYTLDIGLKEWAYAFNGGASLDGTKLFFQHNRGAAHIEEFYVDLSTQKLCSTGNHAFIMATLDGQHLLFQANNAIELRDAETFELVDTLDDIAPNDRHHRLQFFTSGSYIDAFGIMWDNTTQTGEMVWLDALSFDVVDQTELKFEREVISAVRDATYGELYASDGTSRAAWSAWDQSMDFARPVRPIIDGEAMQDAGVMLELIGSHHGEQYYYPRVGRYWKWDTSKAEEVGGGIMVARQDWADEDISWFQRDIPFQHVIMQGNHLYAVEVPLEGDSATIYRLDLVSGEILNSVEVSADVHRLGYARLDTTTLKDTTVTFGSCTKGVLFD
ncbi:MAG: hypothetical protein L0154_31350 [Chloroflexi bacterium]|nr:hypothetical protein [Chloroflexota bacterium]